MANETPPQEKAPAAGPPAETNFDVRKALIAAALLAFGVGVIRLANPRGSGPALVGGIAFVVGLVLSLAVIGKFILGPLDAAARFRRRPTQFTMADFLALVFLFQLPVAIIRLIAGAEGPALAPAYILAWLASSLMWGLSVQTLSRAGIETPWRRVVFLSAVLPIAYFGSLAFLGILVFVLVTVVFAEKPMSMRDWWYLAAAGALPFAFAWASRFVRSMVARSQFAEPPPPADREPATNNNNNNGPRTTDH